MSEERTRTALPARFADWQSRPVSGSFMSAGYYV